MRETIAGSVRTQTAGKAHQCDRKGCRYPIARGMEYRRVIMDNDKVLRFHIPCYTKEFPSAEG